jgi:hypothetical protein
MKKKTDKSNSNLPQSSSPNTTTAAIPTPRAAKDVNKVSRHPGRLTSTAPPGRTRPPSVLLGNDAATGRDS